MSISSFRYHQVMVYTMFNEDQKKNALRKFNTASVDDKQDEILPLSSGEVSDSLNPSDSNTCFQAY